MVAVFSLPFVIKSLLPLDLIMPAEVKELILVAT